MPSTLAHADMARHNMLPGTVANRVVCLHRLIAVLERRVYVHALETLELLGTLETAVNPKVPMSGGLCSRLSP